jgi:hypothetical protein
MKNILYKVKYAILAMGIIAFGSCDSLLDQDETDFGKTPVLVQFEKASVTANFIKTDENPVYSYEIPLVIIGGKNQPIDEDVTVSVSADPSSTATEGFEYNFSGEKNVTISAGQMSATIEIEVLSENLDPFDPKDLVLKIDSSSKTISESSITSLTLQAACQLDMDSFLGTYDAVEDGQYNYIVEVLAGPEPNTLLLTNLYESEGETIIELSEDPSNPTIIYRSEELGAVLYVHATYGDLWATTISPESSSYNSCSNFMALEFKRCVSLGCFGGSVKIELTKQ